MAGDKLTHIDDQGRAHMVDVGPKAETPRQATAIARISMQGETLATILSGGASKGDVLGVARVAGIMAAKRTGELIPLCHPLPLHQVTVAFAAWGEQLWVRAMASCVARTGVEMEALTAASVAALTVYDMAKAMDKAMVIEQVALLHKAGGRSGDFAHPEAARLGPPPGLTWR